MEGATDPILAVEEVTMTFRTRGKTVKALDRVSLRLRPGTITGFIGPDGSGKTTLMRMVAGLLLPDSGHLSVLGIDVLQDPLAVQSSIGYMPQHFGLYEDLTVQENLDLYADLQGLMPEERPLRYEKLMRMTNLAACREALWGNETKTGAGLHAGTPAPPSPFGRAHRRGGPGFAPGTLGHHPATGAARGYDRPPEYGVSG
jgi:ABC-type multidrug transport system ATPase subunit